jgi:hypothetical protein
LPADWANNPARRKAAAVPYEIPYEERVPKTRTTLKTLERSSHGRFFLTQNETLLWFLVAKANASTSTPTNARGFSTLSF